MSSPISTIVQVQITQETAAVPQPSFSIPGIYGPTAVLAVGEERAYNSLAGMLSDGFLTSDPEYIRAAELIEQALAPELWIVGRYSASVAQQDTFQVNTLVGSHLYTFTLNGLPINYTSGGGDTQQAILDALLAAIGVAFPTNPPVTGVRTGTGAGATLTLTSTTPGQAFTITLVDTDLTHVNTVANHSIATDISTGVNAAGQGLWYGLTICSQTKGDILQVAALIETLLKIFIADSHDANILDSAVTTDVASALQDLSYKRTAILYSGTANDGAAAAWLGGQLPQTPGASTWKFKQLVGIAPDELTAAQRLSCIGIPGVPGKNCNIYETVGGVPITEEGFMSGGQFIDLTVFIDWLVSTMQVNVYTKLVQSPKIPYTDQGIAIVENGVRETLNQGVAQGGIDGNSPIDVSVPKVLDIPAADRAERVLPDVTFSCRLAGAIHFVEIQGTVSV